MLAKLSRRKEIVYNFYKKLLEDWQYMSYSEAGKKLEMNASSVFQHVNELINLWYLEKRSDWSLALINTSATQEIPLLWKIACWSPLEVIEEYTTIEVPKKLLQWSGNFYALEAKWTSMEEAWILEGDYVIIKQQSDVNDWEIGVLIERDEFYSESATLKQIFHTKDAILAIPKNPRFKTFQVKNENALIRWKLVWVIRNYI